MFGFDGVTTRTTTDGTSSVEEVQQVVVGLTAGTFTLAYDTNGDGTIAASDIDRTAGLERLAPAAAVQTCFTVGEHQRRNRGHGRRRHLHRHLGQQRQPPGGRRQRHRALTLGAGPFFRITAQMPRSTSPA